MFSPKTFTVIFVVFCAAVHTLHGAPADLAETLDNAVDATTKSSNIFTNIDDFVKGVFDKAFSIPKGIIETVTKTIQNIVKGFLSSSEKLLKDLAGKNNMVVKTITDVLNKINDVNIFDAIDTKANEVIDFVEVHIEGYVGNVKHALETQLKLIKGLEACAKTQNVTGYPKDAVSELTGVYRDELHNLVGSVNNTVQRFADIINALPEGPVLLEACNETLSWCTERAGVEIVLSAVKLNAKLNEALTQLASKFVIALPYTLLKGTEKTHQIIAKFADLGINLNTCITNEVTPTPGAAAPPTPSS